MASYSVSGDNNTVLFHLWHNRIEKSERRTEVKNGGKVER